MLYFTPKVFCHLAIQIQGHISVILEWFVINSLRRCSIFFCFRAAVLLVCNAVVR